MKKKLLQSILVVFLLSSCNLPSRSAAIPSPTADVVATEAVRMLTQAPTATQAPSATAGPGDTSTPAPTATSQPSATASAKITATINPGDPAASLGTPTWQDSLDNVKNFYLYENEHTKIEAGNSSLVLTSKDAVGWHGWTLTYAQNTADFYLEGEFKTGNCAGNDLYGLIFRASKENAGYFFGVTCDGQYNLYARDFNNSLMTEIKPFKANNAIHAGAGGTNRLGVMTKGDQIRLYANGTLLVELNDSTYAKGYFGPFIAGNQTENFSVELDQISLWKQS